MAAMMAAMMATMMTSRSDDGTKLKNHNYHCKFIELCNPKDTTNFPKYYYLVTKDGLRIQTRRGVYQSETSG